MCNIPFGRLSVLFNFHYLFEDLDVFWSFHTLPHSFQTPTQFCVLFFVWHPSGVARILLCVWPFTGVRSNCREPPPSRKLPPPLLPEAIIASSSLTKGGTSHLPPCCMLAFCLVWGCARLVHTVTTVMSSYTQLPCPVWEKHEVTERSNKKPVSWLILKQLKQVQCKLSFAYSYWGAQVLWTGLLLLCTNSFQFSHQRVFTLCWQNYWRNSWFCHQTSHWHGA